MPRRDSAFPTGSLQDPLRLESRTAASHSLLASNWYVKAGIRRAWTPLGATIIYGDYAEYRDQVGPAALDLGVQSSTFRRSGATIAQEIDAASMTIYLKYEHYEADVSAAANNQDLNNLEDADFVSLGALINF